MSSQTATLVERIGSLNRRGGDPLLIVYGPGVDDILVGRDYHARGIEELLWDLLRAEGFERIAFSSLRQPVYFRDTFSRDASRSQPQVRRRRGEMHERLAGPLGRRVVLGTTRAGGGTERGDQKGATQVAVATVAPSPAPALSDPFGVMMLNHFMRQDRVPTAVVFTQAEESLRHGEASRSLAGFVVDWIAQGSGPGNLCVLLFRKNSLEEVRSFVADLRRIPRLESYIDDQRHRGAGRATVDIGYPDPVELERLVHIARLTDGLRIADWRELPLVVRAMDSSGARARDWQAWLHQLSREDTPLCLSEMSKRGWVNAALPDGGSVWDRLDAMPGLAPVKEHLKGRSWLIKANARLAAAGNRHAGPDSLHLVFTGNPGTGKTTVAELVGEMYRDLGLLRRGHVVSAKVSDLVAGYVGQTAALTDKTIDRAVHGVLFIDEAYRLSDQRDGFGQEAIDTLLTRMENDRHRLVVVVAGYPEKMRQFLDSNPGLRSRFPAANVIEFPDFEPGELLAILLGKLTGEGLRWTLELEEQLRQVTRGMYATRDEQFGNGRAMDALAGALKGEWARRIDADVSEPLDSADVPKSCRRYLTQPVPDLDQVLSELDGLVGLTSVKQVITDLVGRIKLRQRRGAPGLDPPHMLFVGPPGTGKTTVARLVGKMFHSLGLLARGHVVEVTRPDLVGRFIGDTAPKTVEAVRKALDGVLFIDEAYSLSRSTSPMDFGHEAIDTLTREMEQHRGRLVLIAAGYPDAMEEFVNANAGLRSRFTERVTFPDYTEAELVTILRQMAATQGYSLGAGAETRAASLLTATRRQRPAEFGNARDVRTLLDRMEGRLAARLSPDTDPVDCTFIAEDVPDVFG